MSVILLYIRLTRDNFCTIQDRTDDYDLDDLWSFLGALICYLKNITNCVGTALSITIIHSTSLTDTATGGRGFCLLHTISQLI